MILLAIGFIFLAVSIILFLLSKKADNVIFFFFIFGIILIFAGLYVKLQDVTPEITVSIVKGKRDLDVENVEYLTDEV